MFTIIHHNKILFSKFFSGNMLISLQNNTEDLQTYYFIKEHHFKSLEEIIVLMCVVLCQF